MARWIRRSLLCIALGFITAWLVAWGVAVVQWAGGYQSTPAWHGRGVGVVEPWLLEMDVYRGLGWVSEAWGVNRLDRTHGATEQLRQRADRVLAIGGAAHEEKTHRERLAYWSEFEKTYNLEPGSRVDGYRDVMMAPAQRIDDQIVSFPPPHVPLLANWAAGTQADLAVISIDRVGWPIPMLASMWGHEMIFAASGVQNSDVEVGSITIDAFQSPAAGGAQSAALSLPYRVIASAAMANTIFFAISWFALITGLELLRSLRRRMAGRCTRCGYDLRRVVGGTCPECGRTKQ